MVLLHELKAVIETRVQLKIQYMIIAWKRCLTYEDARNYSGVIYLHEWDGQPFYWGKAHKSYFGGHMRSCNEIKMSGRYNVGYRHWIEGCLRHGAKLYIGLLNEEALTNITAIENYLIATYPSKMNSKKLKSTQIVLTHEGDIPASVA